ncbi:MAG: hypothetical protein WD768_05060, partial [Phycisphaeraceae bacterium]
MSQDHYTQWLKIAPGPRPPDFYTLLGLPRCCDDAVRIEDAAHEQLDRLDRYALSPDPASREACQRMMNEVAHARVVLRDAIRRAAYNKELAQALGIAPPADPVQVQMPAALPELAPPQPVSQPRSSPASPVSLSSRSSPASRSSRTTPAAPVAVAPSRTPPLQRWLVITAAGSLVALAIVVIVLLIGGGSGVTEPENEPRLDTAAVALQHKNLLKVWKQVREVFRQAGNDRRGEQIDAALAEAGANIKSGRLVEAAGALAWSENQVRPWAEAVEARFAYDLALSKQDRAALDARGGLTWKSCLAMAQSAEALTEGEAAARAYTEATRLLHRAVDYLRNVERIDKAIDIYQAELNRHDISQLKLTGIHYEKAEQALNIAATSPEADDAIAHIEAATALLRRAGELSILVPELQQLERTLTESLVLDDEVVMAKTVPKEWSAMQAARARGRDLKENILLRKKAYEDAFRLLEAARNAPLSGHMQEKVALARKPF